MCVEEHISLKKEVGVEKEGSLPTKNRLSRSPGQSAELAAARQAF